MLHVWNIYQHVPEQNHPNVGKYTSTMVRIWDDVHLSSVFLRHKPSISLNRRESEVVAARC